MDNYRILNPNKPSCRIPNAKFCILRWHGTHSTEDETRKSTSNEKLNHLTITALYAALSKARPVTDNSYSNCIMTSIPFFIGTTNNITAAHNATRGSIHLFDEVDYSAILENKRSVSSNAKSPTTLSSDRFSSTLCILNIPSYMIPVEILRHFSAMRKYLTSFRVFRYQSQPDKYLGLICTSSEEDAKLIRHNYDCQRLSSLDDGLCHLYFVESVRFNGADENYLAQNKPDSTTLTDRISAEDASCAVCLEVLDRDNPQSFETACGHTFHADCLVQLEGPQCPVCRFQHDSITNDLAECFACGWQGSTGVEFSVPRSQPTAAGSDDDDLDSLMVATAGMERALHDVWVCLVCGFTGCGGSHQSHIRQHYHDTLHTYAMNTSSRAVWDFAGHGYVHRLILNTGDPSSSSLSHSKIVEQAQSQQHSLHGSTTLNDQATAMRANLPPLSSEQEEELVNRKLESVAQHYNQLLTWQMEQNRLLYETRLRRIQESFEPVAPKDRDTLLCNESVKGVRKQQSKGTNRNWRENLLQSLTNERGRLIRQCEAARERCSRVSKELEALAALQQSLTANCAVREQRVEVAEAKLSDAERAYNEEVPLLERKVQELMQRLDMLVPNTSSSHATCTSAAVENKDES